MSRVVVVGAGLGGLAAAARLARLRHDVMVVEQSAEVGGRLRPWQVNGFVADPVAGRLTLPAALRDLFLKTGKPLEAVIGLEPADVVARHRFPDGTVLELPNDGTAAAAAAVGAAFGGPAGAEATDFFAAAGRRWDAVRGPLLETPPPAPELRRLAVTRPWRLRALAPRRTLRDVARGAFRDPRARALVEHYAAVAGVDPAVAPATMAVLPYVEHTFRVWQVEGGTERLLAAVRERVLDRRAVVVTGTRAVEVTTSAGRVDGVRLHDGRTLPADVVVSDVDPRAPGAALGAAGLPPAPKAAGQVSTHLLGLRGRSPRPVPTIVLHGDGAPAEPTVTATVTPSGDGEAWLVALPRSEPDTTAVLDLLARRGHDVRDRLVTSAHRTDPAPADRWDRWSTLRAPVARSPLPGWYVVGASPAFGRGIPFSVLAAAVVADRVGSA